MAQTPRDSPNGSASEKDLPEQHLNSRIDVPHHLHNIPIPRNKENDYGQGFLETNFTMRCQRFAAKLKDRCIGPMPPKSFVSTFLPPNDRTMPIVKDTFNNLFALDGSGSIPDVIKGLCDTINLENRCPNFKLRSPDNFFLNRGDASPDVCLFEENLLDTLAGPVKDDSTALGCSDLFLQVRLDATIDDPFVDHATEAGSAHRDFVRTDEDDDYIDDDDDDETEEGTGTSFVNNLGEIAAFAAETCSRQHRTHCFSISIYGSTARFFRWDRAGVIVSELFDLCKTPELLFDFLWRYSCATLAQRGYDTTISPALKCEEDIYQKVIESHIKSQLSVSNEELRCLVKEHYEPHAVVKFSIHPQQPLKNEIEQVSNGEGRLENGLQPWDALWREETAILGQERGPSAKAFSGFSRCRTYRETQYFLASVPVAMPTSSVGRGTRGYWAVKIPDSGAKEDYQIAFLKDTWRDGSETETEGDVMVELVENGVKFISDIYCQGDVLDEVMSDHYTKTDKYAKFSWNYNKKGIHPLRHYRMASIEVGYPLSTFRGSKELIHSGRCAYLAAWSAYVLCRRLHRDISLNNIVLVKKNGRWRVGYLVDWELSCKTDTEGRAEDSARSGTWAYMSVASLAKDGFRHRFQDDMESFYYVMLYAGVHWLPHKKVDNIEKKITAFFDEYDEIEGKMFGGSAKHANLWAGIFHKLWGFKNAFVQDWYSKVLQLQRPLLQQPNWKPEAFHDIWKRLDDADLPNDDRVDNLPRKGSPVECQSISKRNNANRNLDENKKSSDNQKANESGKLSPEIESRKSVPASEEGKSRTSSKRSADDAGFVRNEHSSKRLCPHTYGTPCKHVM